MHYRVRQDRVRQVPFSLAPHPRGRERLVSIAAKSCLADLADACP